MLGIEAVNTINDILGSKTKLRIIKLLICNNALNITKIVRMSGLNHTIIRKNLKELVDKNIIIEDKIDNFTIYRINVENSVVKKLLMIIECKE